MFNISHRKIDYPFMNEITSKWQNKIRNGQCTNKTKVEFICQKNSNHSNYYQSLVKHASGQGCPMCAGNLIKTDYSFMDEITPYWQEKIRNGECNAHTKVEFICQKDDNHPNYMQTLNAHSVGESCPECGNSKRRVDYPFMDEITDEWQLKIRNGECNSNTEVEFLCLVGVGHPNYIQSLRTHLRGYGCPICGVISSSITRRNKDYPFMNEITQEWRTKISEGQCNIDDRVEFMCLQNDQHPNYWQILANHLYAGSGCPICSASKGEKLISNFLDSNNIVYESQKTFSDCRYKGVLRFDFYISSLKIAIEYQGQQHYKSVEYFGGEDALKKQIEKDKVKRKYCEEKSIQLIEIPYWEIDNIDDILLNILTASVSSA